MSDQADQPSDDRIKPWTIKGIAPEVRNAAIAAAERARLPIGEWMSRAIRGQVQSDHQENRAPVPVGPERAPVSDPGADLAQLERLVALTTSLAGAGAPPPKAVSRGAYGLIRQRLAEMKGPTETRSGPTKTAPGQTEVASGLTEEASGPTGAASSLTKPPSSPTDAASSPTERGSSLTEKPSSPTGMRLSPTEDASSPTKPLPSRTKAGPGPTVTPHGQAKGRRAQR